MRADLGALLQHGNANFVIIFRRKLLELYCRRQASRPGANDNDVIFHGFSGHDAFSRLSKTISYAVI